MSNQTPDPNRGTYGPGDPIPPDSVVGNSPLNPNYQPPKKKRHILRNTMLAIGGLFTLLIVISVLTPGTPAKDASAPVGVTSKAGVKTTEPPAVTETTTAPVAPTTTEPTEEATTEPPAEPSMTAGQEQAVGAAEQYLSLKGFSRKGLIEQLSSEYGSGFSVADATFAVDHLKVDWNEQAAKSARAYLELTHFSRSGLIQQLESDFGDGFTHKQAVYGVDKAGL